MKYQFIAAHRQEYPISTMCRVLEVAVSGFYAWLRRAPSRRSQENTGLGERIVRIYHENRQVYGSPRIHAADAELKERVAGASGSPGSCASRD